MNKKIIGLIIIIFSIFILLFILLNENNTINYNDLVANTTEWNSIINSRKKTSKNLISELKFNDYSLLLDNKNTFYYSITENKKNSFNPNVEIYNNIKFIFNKKITNKLIEKNETVDLLVYTNSEYKIYSIKSTTLPIMNITYNDKQEIINDEHTKVNMYLYDNRNNTVKRVVTSEGNMHIRGNISSNYPKKNYKLNLTKESTGENTRKNKLSLLGLRKDDDWILYSGYNDQEKIRNVFASNLWKESCSKNNLFDIENGYEYKYIELFINNQYWGLYALGYPIDSNQLELKKDQYGNYIEYSFKKKYWNINTKMTKETPIIERISYVPINSNDEIGWHSLERYYKKLFATDNPDEIYEMVDISNAIDLYLFYNFAAAVDNATNAVYNDSIFDYKNTLITIKQYNHQKKILYTPWDLDLTFGNSFMKDSKNMTSEYGYKYNWPIKMSINPVEFLHKLEDKKIDKLLKSRYKELRNTYWSNKHINDLINQYEVDIYNSGAFLRDQYKWPDGNHNNNNDKLEKFRTYINDRLEYIDEYINTL